MKRIIALMAMACMVAFANAQDLKLHVSTPGTLCTLVGNSLNVEKLILTGTIDDSDRPLQTV